MVKRGKRTQSKHDKSIKRRALALRSKRWRVWADIPGFRRPRVIRVGRGSARPDIIAAKGRRTRIIEVETPSSMRIDQLQRRLLRRYARRRKRTEYRTGIAR